MNGEVVYTQPHCSWMLRTFAYTHPDEHVFKGLVAKIAIEECIHPNAGALMILII